MENPVSGKHCWNIKTQLPSAAGSATNRAGSWTRPLVPQNRLLFIRRFYLLQYFSNLCKIKEVWVLAGINSWLERPEPPMNPAWAGTHCGCNIWMIKFGLLSVQRCLSSSRKREPLSEGFTWGSSYNKSAVKTRSSRSKPCWGHDTAQRLQRPPALAPILGWVCLHHCWVGCWCTDATSAIRELDPENYFFIFIFSFLVYPLFLYGKSGSWKLSMIWAEVIKLL